MVILTLLFLGLKYCGKLSGYLCFATIIQYYEAFYHGNLLPFVVIDAVILFYYRMTAMGMAVSYRGKMFYNFDPWWPML
jgi:hypothetical protein